MKSIINILGYGQEFPYLIEYIKSSVTIGKESVVWSNMDNTDYIQLFTNDIQYYRNTNEWHNVNKTNSLSAINKSYIPTNIHLSKLIVYVPTHAISSYEAGVKYMLSVNTWINGLKIDLGSYLFKPTDTNAIHTGNIKNGNNEYYECIEFEIIDPFYITYSDDWQDFRHYVCNEPLEINNTGSPLQVSLFIVTENNETNGKYIVKNNLVGGYTSFPISNVSDYLTLKFTPVFDPLGFNFELTMNSEYDWLLTYLYETYGIKTTYNNIKYSINIKNNDNLIIGPTIKYNGIETYGKVTQTVDWSIFDNTNNLKIFFNSWDTFEEGWNLIASVSVIETEILNDNTVNTFELFTVVSNEIPITQELFSKFTNGGTKKIIDVDDMNIIQYNVVNKIENKIVQLERPNESKSNIIQPVFFRVKDSETLILHPKVTENISINLDDYKSKVSNFMLQIDGNNFYQIGANSYGIIFKIPANIISSNTASGIYYILDENGLLVTTGKYTCVN